MAQIEKKVFDFLDSLPPKQKSQIVIKILQLFNNPRPNDSIKLKGSSEDYRTDIGGYRVLCSFSASDGIKILKVGKHNDGEVYR